MDLQNDLDSLMALVSNSFNAFTSAFFQLEDRGQTLCLKSFYSLSPNIIKDCSISVGEGLIGWVAQNQEPLSVSQFRYDAKSLGFYSRDEEIKSFMACPVIRDELVGVLCCDSKSQYVFTPKSQKLLSCFAEQISRLLINASAWQRLAKSSVDTSSLYEVCSKISSATSPEEVAILACSVPKKLIHYDGCALSLLSEDGKSCLLYRQSGYRGVKKGEVRISEGQSLIGLVLRQGKPLILNEAKSGRKETALFYTQEPTIPFSSFIGVPVGAAGELVGVLNFTCQKGPPYGRHHLQLASIIGFHVASALSYSALKRKMAECDQLDGATNFFTRKAFLAKLDQIEKEVSRRKSTYGVVGIGLGNALGLSSGPSFDDFSFYLRQLARIVAKFLGPKDSAGRFDIAEFLLAIVGLEQSRAAPFCEKLTKSLTRAFEEVFKGYHDPSIAVASAIYPNDGRSRDELIAKALGAVRAKTTLKASPPASAAKFAGERP